MKSKRLVLAVVLSATTGVFSSTASAAGPPISNIAPADGAIIAPTTSIEVQFTCPSFSTTYAGVKNWTDYWVHFSTSPIRTASGEFSPTYEVAIEHAYLVSGTTETCRAFFAEPYTETPDTYYWMAERINCDVLTCAEFGPLGSFAIVAPTVPGGSGKQPAEAGVGAARLTAYTACGLSRHSRESTVCSRRQKIGAFFESSKALTYKVCIKVPGGQSVCANNQQAAANTLYVNKITSSVPGRYKVTWTAEGRRLVRHVRRLP